MIFFVDESMPLNKSGVEHAILKRQSLFKKYNTDSKIVVVKFDAQVHLNNKVVNISDNEFISMFDFFQDAQDVEEKKVTSKDIKFSDRNFKLERDLQNNRELVWINDRLIGRIFYLPSTNQVDFVEHHDKNGKLIKVENYDSRGFVSRVDYYSHKNEIVYKQFLKPSGEIVLEVYLKKNPATNQLEETDYILGDKNFQTFNQLKEYFFEQLNNQYDGQNMYIVDRSTTTDEFLDKLSKPAYKAYVIHSTHTTVPQDPKHKVLNTFMEYILNNIEKTDAIITSTKKQADDILNRFPNHNVVVDIPVGSVDDKLLESEKVLQNQRVKGKIVVFSRIATEKRLEHIVKAIGEVKELAPELHLDIYGFEDTSNDNLAKKRIDAEIEKYQLQDRVNFKGYSNEVDEIENNAQLYAVTSEMEGFGLGLLEAVSHGLIPVVYDLNYGPSEITIDKQNGEVVPYEDYKALGLSLAKIVNDENIANEYSKNAYESANRYSQENIWKKWKLILDDANKKERAK